MPVTARSDKGSVSRRRHKGHASNASSAGAGETRKNPARLPKTPKRERARVAQANGPSNVDVTHAQASALLSLPLDVIFEILSFLKPLELANLAQTSRAFRTTLTTPRSPKIWRSARQHAGNAPECPQRMSEISWARFLYGSVECEECGVPNLRNLDFVLMRPMCDQCKPDTLLCGCCLSDYFPGVDCAVLDLIPHVHVESHPWAKYYLDADIVAMATIYGELQRDIEVNTRKAAAKKALHQFKNERIKHVHAVLEHANKCTQWLREFQVYLDNEKQDRIEQYYNQIVRRFRELGYEEQDIQAIRSKSEAMCDRAVTEQVWKQIRPVLQTRVEMARCKRLDKDEEAIITSRKALVRNAYDAYKLTLRPLERLHTPVPELIYAIPAFRALIYMNLDALLKQTACNEAAQRLPEYLSAFNDQLKCCLLQSMLDNGAFDRGARRAKQLPKNADARLSLATTVFKQVIPRKLDRTFFSYNGVVLGMKMLDIWKLSCQADFWVAMYETQGREMEQPTLSYDAHASAAAKTFVVQLGLDHAITRSDDMDDLNGRFVCQHCKHREFLGILRDKAYSWRAAVEHHIIAHTRSNLPMFFKALNEDEVKIVRRIEDGLRLQVWMCNHCPSYNVPATFYDVQEHLTTTHAISKPEENSDYFHAFPAFRYDPPPQSFSRCLQLAAAVDPAEDG